MALQTIFADRLEDSVLTINGLAEVLRDQIAQRGSDPAPQLSDVGIDAILGAIVIISRAAHDDLCELMNDHFPGATGGDQ
ncbi:hypothetical protein [Pseudomonas typographi]|uniref:Prophage PssSM-01 n=1 Tax=Pseudomonas typographi TaxID=2715964 RepID=A0ABR7Z748_9PSED|nr:hypothetical protein [Pseudomonas typographi]MBD1601158.1 hypothetical protein [Pseudomonas typographi]